MYSAFGVDHGEIEKAFNLSSLASGGRKALSAGRHAASGLPKIFGSGGGSRVAGAHKGPMKITNPLGGSTGGAHKFTGAHQAGLRSAGAHAGPAKMRNP